MGQALQMQTWIWKGFVQKSEISSNGMVVVETATEIQENVTVQTDSFIVQKSVNIVGD